MINRYGYHQAYDEDGHPICCECKVIYLNDKGQGMACPQCQGEFERECKLEADWEERVC